MYNLDLLEGDEAVGPGRGGLAKCKCGNLFGLSYPCICACGEPKPYWTMLDGTTLKLPNMKLGHLNNSIRILAARMEEYPQSERGRFEVALDLMYAEIANRPKEIAQVTGILAAIQRGIAREG